MKWLLNRLPIIERETLSSYLFRILKENYYESPYVIINKTITKKKMNQNQFEKDDCLELCSLTREYSLYSHSYKSMNISKEKENDLFLKMRTKFCPICLGEQIHQSFMWGINVIDVCIKHEVYLLNRCRKCNKDWTINSLFKNMCSGCRQSLSKLQAERVTNSIILESQRELTELLLGKKKYFLDLFEINDLLVVLSGFAQLFHGVNSFTQIDVSRYKIEYTNKIPFTQVSLVHFVADLYWLFKDFDNRFPLLLQETFKQGPTRETRKRRQNFEKVISSSANLDFIIKAYHDHRLKSYIRFMNVPKNITSFDSYASEFIEKNYFTKEQVKNHYGILESELDYLMKNDLLTECYLNNGRVTYFLIDKTDKFFRFFLKDKADKVNALEAANILGIHVDRMKVLVKNGVLEYTSYLNKGKFFSKKQIQVFLQLLKPVIIFEVGENISLARCFEKYSKSGLSLLQIISFIRINGLIAYTQTDSYKLSDLFFNPADLAKVITEDRILTKGYNLKQVANELRCNEGTVMKYVEAGLLGKPIKENLNKRAFAYRFEIKYIESFKLTYCSVEQLQEEFNVSSSLVRNAIFRGAIKNHLAGICRKTLVNKWEFKKYLNKRRVQ